MNEVKHIEDFIDKFNLDNTLIVNKDRYEPFHIFHKLIDHFGIRQQKEKYMNVYYQFTLFEKCLNFAREKDLNSATFTSSTIKLDFEEINPEIKEGILSLYNAIIAYLEFAKDHNDKAHSLLDEAIANAKLQSDTFSGFLPSIQEQWLNKIRIYIKEKDKEQILGQSKRLFAFSLFGHYDNELIAERFRTLPNYMHQLMLEHVINAVDIGIIRKFADDGFVDDFYREISAHLAANDSSYTINPYFVNIFKTIDALYTKGDDAFLVLINEHFESIQKSCQALQIFIIQKFLQICRQKEVEIERFQNFKLFSDNIYNYLGINLPVLVNQL